MKKSEVCERAAEIIDEHGWCRYSFHHYGTHCLMGSLFAAMDRKTSASGEAIQDFILFEHELGELLYPVMPPRSGMTICANGRVEVIKMSASSPADIFHYNDNVLKDGRGAVDILIRGAKYWRDRGE
jgi:hypothetical protein